METVSLCCTNPYPTDRNRLCIEMDISIDTQIFADWNIIGVKKAELYICRNYEVYRNKAILSNTAIFNDALTLVNDKTYNPNKNGLQDCKLENDKIHLEMETCALNEDVNDVFQRGSLKGKDLKTLILDMIFETSNGNATFESQSLRLFLFKCGSSEEQDLYKVDKYQKNIDII